jgi:hypothetical protein
MIKLGTALGTTVSTVNQATQSWFESEQSPDQQLVGIENIIITLGTVRLTSRYVNGSTMIWDNVSQGIWGTNVWGGNAFSSAITITHVLNNQNVFQDNLCFNDFNDTTNTTATVSYINNTITFGVSQVYQSLTVAKDSSQSWSYWLCAVDFTGGNLYGYFSADNGVTYTAAIPLSNGLTINGYFPVYGNNIKFKLVGDNGVVVTAPVYLKYG